MHVEVNVSRSERAELCAEANTLFELSHPTIRPAEGCCPKVQLAPYFLKVASDNISPKASPRALYRSPSALCAFVQ